MKWIIRTHEDCITNPDTSPVSRRFLITVTMRDAKFDEKSHTKLEHEKLTIKERNNSLNSDGISNLED